MNNKDVLDLMNNLKQWHENIVTQLETIANAPDDMNIKFDDENDAVIDLPKEMRTPFKAGVQVAINIIGEFPVTINFGAEE